MNTSANPIFTIRSSNKLRLWYKHVGQPSHLLISDVYFWPGLLTIIRLLIQLLAFLWDISMKYLWSRCLKAKLPQTHLMQWLFLVCFLISEDIDPTVGKFRNMVQTSIVIPNKVLYNVKYVFSGHTLVILSLMSWCHVAFISCFQISYTLLQNNKLFCKKLNSDWLPGKNKKGRTQLLSEM